MDGETMEMVVLFAMDRFATRHRRSQSAFPTGRLAVLIHPVAAALALDGHKGAFFAIVATRRQHFVPVTSKVPSRFDQPFQYEMGRIAGSYLGNSPVSIDAALTRLSTIL
jgi:hypothetical protein